MPHWGTSNEYPQHMFSSRNKKNIATFWLKKAPYQELWWKCQIVFFVFLKKEKNTTKKQSFTFLVNCLIGIKQGLILIFLWIVSLGDTLEMVHKKIPSPISENSLIFIVNCLIRIKQVLTFLVNFLLSRQFTRNVKPCFLRKAKSLDIIIHLYF